MVGLDDDGWSAGLGAGQSTKGGTDQASGGVSTHRHVDPLWRPIWSSPEYRIGPADSAGDAGTYVSVEPSHLFRYLDEQALRVNSPQDE
jgi:hypothetical protein